MRRGTTGLGFHDWWCLSMYSGNRFGREETTLRSAVHAPIGTERHDTRDSFLSIRDAHPCASCRAITGPYNPSHPRAVLSSRVDQTATSPVQSRPLVSRLHHRCDPVYTTYLSPPLFSPLSLLPSFPLVPIHPSIHPSIHPIHLILPDPLPLLFSARACAQPAGSDLAKRPRLGRRVVR